MTRQVLQGKRIAVTGAFGALGTVVLRAVTDAGASAAGIAHAPASKAPSQLGGIVLFGDAESSNAGVADATLRAVAQKLRSEVHSSELQSRRDLVCRLLLEKKK